jgi:hypothetical protein
LTTLKTTALKLQLRGASLEVCLPSSTLSRAGPPDPGFASPGYVPPSGFLSLLAAYSLLDRGALFHAPGAHGV